MSNAEQVQSIVALTREQGGAFVEMRDPLLYMHFRTTSHNTIERGVNIGSIAWAGSSIVAECEMATTIAALSDAITLPCHDEHGPEIGVVKMEITAAGLRKDGGTAHYQPLDLEFSLRAHAILLTSGYIAPDNYGNQPLRQAALDVADELCLRDRFAQQSEIEALKLSTCQASALDSYLAKLAFSAAGS